MNSKVPERWTIVKLGDIAELYRNSFIPSKIDTRPYIGLEHIEKEKLCLIKIGKSSDTISNKYEFNKGQILFGKLRPYFRKVILADFDGVCSTDIFVIKSKEKIDNKFLFYLMASKEMIDAATRGSTGTKMPRASWDFLERLDVLIPLQKSEQKKIGEILNSFDEKIKINKQINQTLEAIAQALFKHWFIDFEFPNEEGKAYKSSGGEMVDSELGEIPLEFDIITLTKEFDLIMGQSPPGTTYNENKEGLPFFQGKTDFSFRYPTKRIYCTAPKKIASSGDTLVSVRAPIGAINMAFEKCCIGRGLSAFRHKSGSRSYTYYMMRFLTNIFSNFEAEGTVFGCIKKTDFQMIRCIRPPLELIQRFEQITFPLDQKIENNEREIRNLTLIRDTLLPKLMSGKIRISLEGKT
ncbi:MAG: restriction endonuclease subunit S [Candidatus Helarchaeota archaeon]